MTGTRFAPGDHNIICDRTGQKIKRSEARKEWNNMIVRKRSWEPRHPQDLLRSRPDRQQVPDPRSESTDVFFKQVDFRFTASGDRRLDSTGAPRSVISAGAANVSASDL